jgi:hypothetical protein
MALKKKETTKANGATASQTKGAAKAAKKASASKAASTVTAETTPKANTPKGADAAKAAPNAAPKKVAPVKLTERQHELLQAISAAKEAGYPNEKKAEQKTIDALVDKKLVKKGAKDKQSGHTRYHLSKGGEKFLALMSAGS